MKSGRIIVSFQDYDGDSWLLQPDGRYRCTTIKSEVYATIDNIRAIFGPLHHINYKEA